MKNKLEDVARALALSATLSGVTTEVMAEPNIPKNVIEYCRDQLKAAQIQVASQHNTNNPDGPKVTAGQAVVWTNSAGCPVYNGSGGFVRSKFPHERISNSGQGGEGEGGAGQQSPAEQQVGNNEGGTNTGGGSF